MDAVHPLRAYRKTAGKSLEDVARAVGTARSTISRIETGDIMPSLGLIARLKQATNGALTAEDFMPMEAAE